MTSVSYGKQFLKLKRNEISIEQFLDGYFPLNDGNFKKVQENELGEHTEHEKAHASVLDKADIGYDFYLSQDEKIALTKAHYEDLKVYALPLDTNEFIEFLKEFHNPPVKNFVMDGTDLFVYKILAGDLKTDEEIEKYGLSLYFEKSDGNAE